MGPCMFDTRVPGRKLPPHLTDNCASWQRGTEGDSNTRGRIALPISSPTMLRITPHLSTLSEPLSRWAGKVHWVVSLSLVAGHYSSCLFVHPSRNNL